MAVSPSFIKQYSAEVKQAFQQKGSKLRNAVRAHTGVVGSTEDWHKLSASTSTQTPAWAADFTLAEAGHTVVTATLVDYYDPQFIRDLDKLKSNIDYRKDYVSMTVNNLGRKCDELIITALDATTVSAPTATGGLTYEKLLEAKLLLDEAGVDEADRFLAISPAAHIDLLAETELTSSDYNSRPVLENGYVRSFLGFNIISAPVVKSATEDAGPPAIEKAFAFHKSAIGLSIGQDIKTRIDYEPMKAGNIINTCMSMGAVLIEAAGVVEITVEV